MKKNITIGEKYGPTIKITDAKQAQKYFAKCVEHTMRFGHSRQKAEQIERSNIGYYAGYDTHRTRLRVEKLFNCQHPLFGEAKNGVPTSKEAFEMGCKRGKS